MLDATHSTDSLFTVDPTDPKVIEARAREAARYAEVAKNHWTGAKYVAGRTLAEIKALILADVKVAKCLPKGARISAQIPSYSMANEIRVTVKLPFVVDGEWRSAGNRMTRYTPEADKVVEAIRAIANAYNYDRSDMAADHKSEAFGLRVPAVSL